MTRKCCRRKICRTLLRIYRTRAASEADDEEYDLQGSSFVCVRFFVLRGAGAGEAAAAVRFRVGTEALADLFRGLCRPSAHCPQPDESWHRPRPGAEVGLSNHDRREDHNVAAS